MARTWVPLAAFEHRTLPAICAKTGAAPDRELLLRARSPSRWVWLLLLLGVVPYLLVRQFLTREVEIALLISERAARRLDRARLARQIALLEGLPLLVLWAGTGQGEVLALGAVCLAGALVAFAFELGWSVGARLDWSARGILLTCVHPAFRDAVDHRHRSAWLEADDAWPSLVDEPCRPAQAGGQVQGVWWQRGQPSA
jgi:hypothetical protein